MLSASTVLYALLGGALPAVVWLFFWLSEDKRCPEPKGLIVTAFIAGMLSVVVVIPLEHISGLIFSGLAVIVVWAVIEEVVKFLFAYVAVLRNKAMNEPIDAVIYMITVALGFAAIENTLFLLSPIEEGLIIESILTGNLRFIGATLLHTLASALVGIAIAFSFYRERVSRRAATIVGLILASTLHALFNFFILRGTEGDNSLLLTFLGVWFGIIFLILLFEKIKVLRNPRNIFTK